MQPVHSLGLRDSVTIRGMCYGDETCPPSRTLFEEHPQANTRGVSCMLRPMQLINSKSFHISLLTADSYVELGR